MSLNFINVKPGRYKFVVQENVSVKEQIFNIVIDPVIRKEDNFVEIRYDLDIKEKSHINLLVE